MNGPLKMFKKKDAYSKRTSSHNFFRHMGNEKSRTKNGLAPRSGSYEEPFPQTEAPGTISGMKFFDIEKTSYEGEELSPPRAPLHRLVSEPTLEYENKIGVEIPQAYKDHLDSLLSTGMTASNVRPWHQELIRSNGFKDVAIGALSSVRKSGRFDTYNSIMSASNKGGRDSNQVFTPRKSVN